MDAIKKTSRTPVKQAFLDSGLKQEYVSRLVGFSSSKLSKIVNGGAATREDKVAIAMVLRRPVDELFPDTAQVA